MADFVLDTCCICGVTCDAEDGDDAPVCVKCYDKGYTGERFRNTPLREWLRTDPGEPTTFKERVEYAKRRRVLGESVGSIAASMNVGVRTVYHWLRK